MARKSFEVRLKGCKSPLVRKLFEIIIRKKTTLCVAANLKSPEEVIDLVEKIHPYICMLKIQTCRLQCSDSQFTKEHLELLHAYKKKYDFLLFEDNKLSDCSDTSVSWYKNYVKYVDIITVWPYYDEIFTDLSKVAQDASLPKDEPRGCLAICEVSYANLTKISTDLLETSMRNGPTCVGIIAQQKQVQDEFQMIKASPGVHIDRSGDGHGQNWRHPEKVVQDGADILIVGRGIVGAPPEEWEELAKLYQQKSFDAYLASL